MENWRFALGGRWFGYLALAIVFAVVCVLLGEWQLGRRVEAVAEIDRVANNYDAPPVPLAQALPRLDSWRQSIEWARVELHGSYLAEDQLLVRNRTSDTSGAAGFEVLTPLRLDGGDVFVVDRGWLPTGAAQDSPDAVPAPPAGDITVLVHLQASEPMLAGKSAPPGQIATIHLPAVATLVGAATYTGAYGLMVSESPAPATRPMAASKPTPDEGPHLSYAVQWFIFAAFGFLGLGYALRQEYRLVNAEDPEERVRAAERYRKSQSKPPSDAEVEDAIVDARR